MNRLKRLGAETVYCVADAGAGFLGCYVWATTGGFGGLAYGFFIALIVVVVVHGLGRDVFD